jgi:hypothetical protein
MRKDAPLTIHVPPQDRDGPGWVKVGVIAAVGFVIGIAWPRLVGVRVGPSAPGEAASAAASASAQRAPRAEATPAGVTPKGSASASAPVPASAAVPAASAAAGPPSIAVQKGAVLTCKTDDGESKKGKECGSLASLDLLVQPRLRKIAQCSAAEGQSGKLSFVVNADFKSGRLGWDVGKSSTVGNVEGVTSCLKTLFAGTALNGVSHDHAKYTVAYTAMLSTEKAADKPDTKDGAGASVEPKAKDDDAPAATGEATVAWEVALVRDVPKTGQVVTRLHRGEKVKLGAMKDGWYSIKYGEALANDGWVYRGALGK